MFEKIKQALVQKLITLNLNNDEHLKRIDSELKDIIAKSELKYFLDLSKECKSENTYYENENNLLVNYLLGICKDFDISTPPVYEYGEYPDIDVDYIDEVREYLKEDYAKKTFGEECVCNISNYSTFKVKGAIKDMARIFKVDFKEVNEITSNKNFVEKDDENKDLTWEECLEENEELKAFSIKYPEVCEAASMMLGRVKGNGQHASGLVVAGVPINEYVPLIRSKDGKICSAWAEGQAWTDLSSVGFIKFDFLGLDGIQKVAYTLQKFFKKLKEKIPEEMHSFINFKDQVIFPGEANEPWNDDSFLLCKKSLQKANAGALRMVFQFDGSDSIRKLARDGGVDNFEDLVAYTSLFRPGPMKNKMHEIYVERKRGKSGYTIHPKLQHILGKTYGILIYQEQCMQVLNLVGRIPLRDCEAIRKAISKKKVEKFIKYKEQFIKNGQEVLEISEKEIIKLWDDIEAFAGYGFNRSHAVAYTLLSFQMLWLKTNIKEFFAVAMTLANTAGQKDYDKIKEYKNDCLQNGLKIKKIDINTSKWEFELNEEEDTLLWGLCKIKDIGEEHANKIIQSQPYNGFVDFLDKAKPDAKTIKPLVALGCFSEKDKETLLKFFETWRLNETKIRLDIKRKTSALMDSHIVKNPIKKVISLDDFVYKEKKPTKTKKENIFDIIKDQAECEKRFLGFEWEHPLEKLKNYQGFTIKSFLDSQDPSGLIEVVIKEITKKKGPKVTYYSIKLEDANKEVKYIMVWESEFQRFEEILKAGNPLRMRVLQPKLPYPTLSVYQFPRYKPVRPENDDRMVLLT